MPNWNAVLHEIEAGKAEGLKTLDRVRRKYLKKLFNHTKRNVIAYYSGWLSCPSATPNLAISDIDMNGFMMAVHRLDRQSGLDLILHTPGGYPEATEAIVNYLWTIFNKNIRVIVPQLAMSAGTMIACSAKTILMGKQSSLGPIDPQMGGIAAQAVLNEFNLAVRTIESNPASIPLWQSIISQYPLGFFIECKQAIELSEEMLRDWLHHNMFADHPNADIEKIVSALSNHAANKIHARHFSMDDCRSMGLHVEPIEEDDVLQDLVLTIHHAFMHTFSQSHAIKIIENHLGAATIFHKASE